MTTKYHKQFGQVEIISQDSNVTVIRVVETSEEKRLLTKFANMLIQDEPFVKVTKKKVVQAKPVFTEQDDINVAIYQEKERKKLMREMSMTFEQKRESNKYNALR